MKYVRYALVAFAVAFATPAVAQQFPTKSVTIVVPFAAGGSNDIIGRYLAEHLGKSWGQPVVVSNMPGAGSAIGSAHVSKAAPDGYTLLLASVTFTMNPAVQRNLPYDPAKGFKPVAIIGKVPLVLVVGKSVPANTIQDFIKTAKSKELAYATAGLGGLNQFASELLARAAGIKMTPVHYKGGSEAMTDVIGGHADLFVSSMNQALPLIRGGQLRGLMVTSAERTSVAPEIPTAKEAGFEGVEIEQWWGVLAPAGTPDAVVQKINADINKILASDAAKEFLARDAARPTPMTVEAFSAMVQAELQKWRTVAENANIKAE